MTASKLDLIVSQIIELSLEQGSDDPVRDIHSVTVSVDNKVENIMRYIREQERQCATAQT